MDKSLIYKDLNQDVATRSGVFSVSQSSDLHIDSTIGLYLVHIFLAKRRA